MHRIHLSVHVKLFGTRAALIDNVDAAEGIRRLATSKRSVSGMKNVGAVRVPLK